MKKYKNWDISEVNDLELLVEKFTNMVKGAAGKGEPLNKWKSIAREKWFDKECVESRKISFKFLNLYRKTNSEIIKNWYIRSNREYKNMCALKRATFYKSAVNKIENAKDAKQLWESTRINIFKQIKFICGPNLPSSDWVNHFKQLLNPPLISSPIQYAEPYVPDESLDSKISTDEIIKVIKKTKNNKAPGQDRIPLEFLKNMPDETVDLLRDVFNKMWEKEEVPTAFKKNIIFPLYKKGDRNEVKNYRGISLLNSVASSTLYAFIQ